MTAHTYTHSTSGLDQMAQGVQTIVDSALRSGAAGVSRKPVLGAIRAKLHGASQRLLAAVVANREALALAEIERIDPRLGAEIRAAKDRAEALRETAASVR